MGEPAARMSRRRQGWLASLKKLVESRVWPQLPVPGREGPASLSLCVDAAEWNGRPGGPAMLAVPGAASLLPPHVQSRGIFSHCPSGCLSLPGHRPLPSLLPSLDPTGFPTGPFLGSFGTGRDMCIASTPQPPLHSDGASAHWSGRPPSLLVGVRGEGDSWDPSSYSAAGTPPHPQLTCCREVSRLRQRSKAFTHRLLT